MLTNLNATAKVATLEKFQDRLGKKTKFKKFKKLLTVWFQLIKIIV